MSFQDLVNGRSIDQQPTSRTEIQELLRVAARSLRDADAKGLSPEGRFALAYDGALQLSTIALRCAGYRTRGEGHHWAVFDALPDMIDDTADIAGYFQTCRAKRSTAIYRRASVVSEAEADELVREVGEFDRLVRKWLKAEYPQYA